MLPPNSRFTKSRDFVAKSQDFVAKSQDFDAKSRDCPCLEFGGNRFIE